MVLLIFLFIWVNAKMLQFFYRNIGNWKLLLELLVIMYDPISIDIF